MTNKEKPVFGTTEWAASNLNYLKGCSNDCKYCFSKEMSIRFKRKTPDNWKEEEVNWEAYNKSIRNREGYIMFPSTQRIRGTGTFIHKIFPHICSNKSHRWAA